MKQFNLFPVVSGMLASIHGQCMLNITFFTDKSTAVTFVYYFYCIHSIYNTILNAQPCQYCNHKSYTAQEEKLKNERH